MENLSCDTMPTLITQTQDETQTPEESYNQAIGNISDLKTVTELAGIQSPKGDVTSFKKMCRSNNDVKVKSHTRRRKKSSTPRKKLIQSTSTNTKSCASMDHASFAEILRIQKVETAEWKKKNVSNPSTRLNCEKWNEFWKNAASLEKNKL